jgi:hypothetical protein
MLPHMACDPRSHAHLKSEIPYGIRREVDASRMAPTLAARRSDRSVVPPIRRPVPSLHVVRRCACAGGRRARCRALGSCSATRRFRVVAPSWSATHGTLPHLESPTEYRIRRVITTHPVSPRATLCRPVAPCDPASGSRTAGALCGWAEGAATTWPAPRGQRCARRRYCL